MKEETVDSVEEALSTSRFTPKISDVSIKISSSNNGLGSEDGLLIVSDESDDEIEILHEDIKTKK